jgi:hypothetical protein
MRDPDRLYNLMPAVYRERDAAEGYPLRALLRLIGEQAAILDGDIRRLWDGFFIETCDRWMIPYIGDLVANNLLHGGVADESPDTARALLPDLVGPDLRPDPAVRLRADVAKTIYYRRRKGTLPMLEELARDVTGWAAHAVEFFERLEWTQHLEHLRLFSAECPDLRSVEVDGRVDGPFDAFNHTADVRPIRQAEGWYNLRNVGFFLWRLGSYPLANVPARPAGQPWQFHFSPLGNPAPLFSRWRRAGDEAGLSTELHVPGPIRPAAFHADLVRFQALPPPKPDSTDYYGLFEPFPGSPMLPGPDCSFAIIRDGQPVPPGSVRCQDLATWSQPTGAVVGVDVSRGRMAFGTAFQPTAQVDVFYHYGFSANLGGGPYDRRKWLVASLPEVTQFRVKEDGIVPPGAPPATHTSVASALADWAAAGRPNTILTILDSRTYPLPGTLRLSNERWLAIEAADGQCPLLRTRAGGLEVQVLPPEVPGAGAALTLSGVVVEGFLRVTGDLGWLRLLHATLVPGRRLQEDGSPANTAPSLTVDGGPSGMPINGQLRLQVAFSITGPLRLPAHAAGVWLLDSIVDGLGGATIAAPGAGPPPGPPAVLERVTLLGAARVQRLTLASEVIFAAPVTAEQQQAGCVRFSYVPPGSVTPRRYQCQPDREITVELEQAEQAAAAKGTTLTPAERQAIRDAVRAWLVPSFTAVAYGLPGYAQLRLGCPVQIRTGAADGSEMGAFSHLQQPQRETNLRIRLEEYLPFGLDAGLIYVT